MDEPGSAALFELADAILAVARHLEVAKNTGREDGSPLHGAVLRHIDQHPGVSVGEVAESNRILSSNVSRAVRGLEQAGYIHRVPDTVDARKVRLYPTEKAAANLVRLRGRWSELLAGISTSRTEVAQLTAELNRIEAHLRGAESVAATSEG